MPNTEIVYVGKCDTHNALFGETINIKHLDGFLLSAAYVFTDSVARRLFDKDGAFESKGVPIERIVGIYRQQFGNQPWLICKQCADYLSLKPEDRRAASEATRRVLNNPHELGHAPAIADPRASNTDAIVIAYASRLIPSKEEMASLTVFYDEIWLPHPCDLSSRGVKNLASYFGEIFGRDFEIPGLREAQDMYEAKCEEWKLLFDEGILRRMPPFERFGRIIKNDNTISFIDYINWFTQLPKEAEKFALQAQHLESLVLAMHRLDAKKTHPELFISDSDDRTTVQLAGILNNAILACRIPMLSTLNADQILSLRTRVKDVKQGYRQYLNQLTDELEKRIDLAKPDELNTARKLAERKVIPEYENYVRHLKDAEMSVGAKLLQAGSKFLQVDAAPWTPKFWGAILEFFSTVISSKAEENRAAYLSNEKQAFHYLATVVKSTQS